MVASDSKSLKLLHEWGGKVLSIRHQLEHVRVKQGLDEHSNGTQSSVQEGVLTESREPHLEFNPLILENESPQVEMPRPELYSSRSYVYCTFTLRSLYE